MDHTLRRRESAFLGAQVEVLGQRHHRDFSFPCYISPGTTWCAQPDPVVNADSPGELAERIRIAHMAPPDGAVPLASWRSYLARARKRREYDDAVARIWREKKPRAGDPGRGGRSRSRPGHPA